MDMTWYLISMVLAGLLPAIVILLVYGLAEKFWAWRDRRTNRDRLLMLRGLYGSIAEDWDDPSMDVYDDPPTLSTNAKSAPPPGAPED